MSVTYMTRQQKAVLECIETCEGGYTSAAALTEQLHRQGQAVGLTTVYRQLEKLAAQGLVHKIVTDEGTCYQYCNCARHQDCFLLKCEKCGKITHVDCEQLSPLYRHLEAEHHFSVDPRRTMLYGVCSACREACV